MTILIMRLCVLAPARSWIFHLDYLAGLLD